MKSIHSPPACLVPIVCFGVLFLSAACTAEVPSSAPVADTSRVVVSGEAPSVGPPPFDRAAAARALAAVDVRRCRTDTGPTGSGHVTVTFGNDGAVVEAVVDDGPHRGTSEGACIEGELRKATVPPFSGSVVRVGKTFTIP